MGRADPPRCAPGRRRRGDVLSARLSAPFAALALAPPAVLPEYRRRGIGSALVRQGLAEAEAARWRGVLVLGEPAFCRRFSFDVALAAGRSPPFPGPPLMLRPRGGTLPAQAGRLAYPPAFGFLG